ncbi:MAG: hypothetical protein PHE56_05765 [Bacteroidales bacterium]|nr:hypothetical protein [Bacteroidales bacterium]
MKPKSQNFVGYQIRIVQTFVLLLSFSVTTGIFSSCDDEFHFVKKVKIKGKIVRSKGSTSDSEKSTKGEFSLDNAEKVLIFYGRDYDLVNIDNDGSFAGRAPVGTATTLVFLTENNEFIGNLYVGGLNFLPLVSANGEIEDIDLSELTLDGERVIPSNDPTIGVISLSATELAFMQEIGSYYKALSQNLDMNNDGTPDVLQDGKIDITFGCNYPGGKFGIGDDAPSLDPIFDSLIGYSIFMEGPLNLISSGDNSLPQNAVLTGPEENPSTDLYNSGNSYSNGSNFKVNFARGQGFGQLAFEPGLYTMTIDSKDFTFYYSMIDFTEYFVRVIPTLVINSQNLVTAINFEYELPNGTSVNPRLLMGSGIDINISNSNNNFIYQFVSELNSPTDLDYNYYSFELEEPIEYSQISDIGLTFIDLFGNSCGSSWKKP